MIRQFFSQQMAIRVVWFKLLLSTKTKIFCHKDGYYVLIRTKGQAIIVLLILGQIVVLIMTYIPNNRELFNLILKSKKLIKFGNLQRHKLIDANKIIDY
jgi:hypothetical protein